MHLSALLRLTLYHTIPTHINPIKGAFRKNGKKRKCQLTLFSALPTISCKILLDKNQTFSQFFFGHLQILSILTQSEFLSFGKDFKNLLYLARVDTCRFLHYSKKQNKKCIIYQFKRLLLYYGNYSAFH